MRDWAGAALLGNVDLSLSHSCSLGVPLLGFWWRNWKFLLLWYLSLSLWLLRFPPPAPWNFTFVCARSECPSLHLSHWAPDWSSQPEDSCLSLILGNVLLLIDWLIIFFSPPSAHGTSSASLQLPPGVYPGIGQQLLCHTQRTAFPIGFFLSA